MPPLAEQHVRIQGLAAVFMVLRLLTLLKMSYEAAKKRAEPYTKIVAELPKMRHETRCNWCDRLLEKAAVPMCWSTIAPRGMHHSRCRHLQRCYATRS
jgi:hypothetical protein